MTQGLTPLNGAPVLDQLDRHWGKIAAILLWQLAGDKKVVIGAKEMAAFSASCGDEPGKLILFTHGTHDQFEFQFITREAAAAIAAHQQTMKGSA